MKKLFCFVAILFIFGIVVLCNNYSNNDIAGRGCCSRHNGVCGCKNGHAQCCDGTQSPSCQCFHDDIKGFGT